MPELDELLHEAADEAALRARGGDFEAVVRGARRRRTRLAAAGAAGLVAVIAIGAAAVAGLPGRVPARLTNPAASASPAVSVSADPAWSVRALETDVPFLTFTFDKRHTLGMVQREISLGRTPLPGYWDMVTVGAEREGDYPSAPVAPPFMLLSGAKEGPATRANAAKLAADARELPGVVGTELVTARGCWFWVRASRDSAERPPRTQRPFIPDERGFMNAETTIGTLGNGRFRYTVDYYFTSFTMTDAKLLKLHQDLVTNWGEGAKITLTPLVMRPA